MKNIFSWFAGLSTLAKVAVASAAIAVPTVGYLAASSSVSVPALVATKVAPSIDDSKLRAMRTRANELMNISYEKLAGLNVVKPEDLGIFGITGGEAKEKADKITALLSKYPLFYFYETRKEGRDNIPVLMITLLENHGQWPKMSVPHIKDLASNPAKMLMYTGANSLVEFVEAGGDQIAVLTALGKLDEAAKVIAEQGKEIAKKMAKSRLTDEKVAKMLAKLFSEIKMQTGILAWVTTIEEEYFKMTGGQWWKDATNEQGHKFLAKLLDRSPGVSRGTMANILGKDANLYAGDKNPEQAIKRLQDNFAVVIDSPQDLRNFKNWLTGFKDPRYSFESIS